MKPFEELEFYDDFMFGVIMRNTEFCKGVLEILLDIKIDRIEYPELQKSVEPFYTTKGVRFDVYVENGNRVFDIEIQNSPETELGKRSRYYQSMIDMASLMRGQEYEDLKESKVIFLCRFDPFKKGLPCYTIEKACKEDGSVELNDKATLYVFNCKAYESVGNSELQKFLKYVETGHAESDFTRRLQKMVEIQKEKEELKTTYLAWSLADHDARARGEREGMNRKAVESAKNFLALHVATNEQIAQAVGLPLETIEELAKQV